MTNKKTERPHIGWSLLLWWLAASTIGFGTAAVFHFPGDFRNGEAILAFAWAPALFGGILGAVSGVPAGFLQWLILRRYLVGASRWILATALGVGLTHGLSDSIPYTIALEVTILVSGVFIGAIQWLYLRRQVTQASWWILVSLISWYAAWAIGLAILESSGLYSLSWRPGLDIQTHGTFSFVFGSVYGLITGVVIFVFLPRRKVEA